MKKVSTDRKYHKTPAENIKRRKRENLEAFKCISRNEYNCQEYFRFTVLAESREEVIASFIYNQYYRYYNNVNLPSTLLVGIGGKKITNEEVNKACDYLEKWFGETDGTLVWLSHSNKVITK